MAPAHGKMAPLRGKMAPLRGKMAPRHEKMAPRHSEIVKRHEKMLVLTDSVAFDNQTQLYTVYMIKIKKIFPTGMRRNIFSYYKP